MYIHCAILNLEQGIKMTVLHNDVKQEKLNMRINSEERGLIDRAAKIKGKNRSDFILSAARREAEETILGNFR